MNREARGRLIGGVCGGGARPGKNEVLKYGRAKLGQRYLVNNTRRMRSLQLPQTYLETWRTHQKWILTCQDGLSGLQVLPIRNNHRVMPAQAPQETPNLLRQGNRKRVAMRRVCQTSLQPFRAGSPQVLLRIPQDFLRARWRSQELPKNSVKVSRHSVRIPWGFLQRPPTDSSDHHRSSYKNTFHKLSPQCF